MPRAINCLRIGTVEDGSNRYVFAVYSVPDLAEAFGLGRSTVYRLLRSGELKAHKIGKRTVITATNVEDWLSRLESLNDSYVTGLQVLRVDPSKLLRLLRGD